MKETWIKVVEYASKPYMGMSRKIRGGYSIEFNGDGVLEGNVIFEIYDTHLRVIAEVGETVTNAYFDWDKISSIATTTKKGA